MKFTSNFLSSFRFTYYLINVLIVSVSVNIKSMVTMSVDSVDGVPVDQNNLYKEKWRPQYHFSPPTSWINDPNGLTYKDGQYHLFFQYHPGSLIWGPMHWGHAVSTDLLTWENLPIALYPNQDGTVFSGGATVDSANITGLQKDDKSTLIAIFTRYNETSPTPQTQHLAYSPDGLDWSLYDKNPILVEQGKPDFRDPSISRYGDDYILALAAGDAIQFYQSKNLLHWTFLSSFGSKPSEGSHGGVWECPALMTLELNGQKYQVLLVSINPGGPNTGSATQYFVGSFDGTKFVNKNPSDRVLWMDWGPDNYAASIWTNSPQERPTLISWMNNWGYAANESTTPWRGQMTLPRSLQLVAVNNDPHLSTYPIDEVVSLHSSTLYTFDGEPETESLAIQHESSTYHLESKFTLKSPSAGQILIKLSNQATGEFVSMKLENMRITINRANSGVSHFSSNFTREIQGTRVSSSENVDIDLFFDVSCVELFFDKGLTSFTYLVYPNQPYDLISIECTECKISKINMYQMKTIWDKVSTL